MKVDQAGNPIIDQFSADGFVDLTFRIQDLVANDDYYHFHLAASYARNVVGLNVTVWKDIQGGLDRDMQLVKDHVYRKAVRFLRSGIESDRLIAAISELYGQKSTPKRMIAEETFTAIALHEGELDLDIQGAKIKLFGRDDEPIDVDAYYESFFNLDIPNGFVYWNEKDPGYRAPLLRALGVV